MSTLNPADTADFTIRSELEQLAAKYFGPLPCTPAIAFGARSHCGKVRDKNEDHYAVVRRLRTRDVLLSNLPDGFLPKVVDESYTLAVADGIGGSAFGEVASMFALRAGWDMGSQAFKWHFHSTGREINEVMEVVRIYAQMMHRKLGELIAADQKLTGMGTTITAALIVGTEAVIAHVGDSRAYLFREGKLRCLTRDHTLAQQMLDQGLIKNIAEAPALLRSTLINCLGGRVDDVDVDVLHVPLAAGDQLLLCSDGLTDMVAERDIASALRAAPDPDVASQALIDLALERGGKDNVTVVLARLGEAPA